MELSHMDQRLNVLTLGVRDLDRAKTFYEHLGWRGQEVQETVFFQAGGLVIVLWARASLAEDAGVPDRATDAGDVRFEGMALAQNVQSVAEVDAVLALHGTALAAGVTVVVGVGMSPGLSCLLVRHASGLLDVVDEIHVARDGAAGPAV